MKKNIIISIIITLFFYLSVNQKTFAASFQGLSVFPEKYTAGQPDSNSRFEYELYPGEKISDKIRISNKSGQDATYKIFAADGKTTADGAFALSGINEEKTDLAQWIKLSQEEISIRDGQEALVNFSIEVPSNVEVGDHLGGISVFDVNQDKNQETEDGFNLNITTRVGVRIYVTIPGEIIKKMEITELSGTLNKKTDQIDFNFGLENTGNVRVEPEAELTIYNSISGNKIETFPINLRMVLPGKPTNVPIVWENTPILGKFLVKSIVKYGDQSNEMVQKDIELFFISQKAKKIALITGLGLFVLTIFSIKILTRDKMASLKNK